MLIKGDPRTRQISQLGGQKYKERRERLRKAKIKDSSASLLRAHRPASPPTTDTLPISVSSTERERQS